MDFKLLFRLYKSKNDEFINFRFQILDFKLITLNHQAPLPKKTAAIPHLINQHISNLPSEFWILDFGLEIDLIRRTILDYPAGMPFSRCHS